MTTAVEGTNQELAAWADAWFDSIADPEWQALSVLWWAGETFGDSFAITSSMAGSSGLSSPSSISVPEAKTSPASPRKGRSSVAT